MDLQALQHLDAAHHLHPFCDNAALARKGTRILTRGEGVYVWDAEGNQLLDAFAGLWCVNIGYGRKSMGAAAAKQMETLAYYNSFFQCTTEPTVALSATHSAITSSPRWCPMSATARTIARLIESVAMSRMKLPSILIMSIGRFLR